MTVRDLITELQSLPIDAHVVLSHGWPGETIMCQSLVTHVYAAPVEVWVDDDDESDDPPFDGDVVVWLATHPSPDEWEGIMGTNGTVVFQGIP